MNTMLEFHPEAAAEVQCVTGDYDAKVPSLGFVSARRWRVLARRSFSFLYFGESVRGAIGESICPASLITSTTSFGMNSFSWWRSAMRDATTTIGKIESLN